MDKEVQEFCRKYEAVAGPSQQYRRRVRHTPINFQAWQAQDPDTPWIGTQSYQDVPCVEIHMPEDRFRALMEHDHWLERQQRRGDGYIGADAVRIAREREHECRLRHEHPGVQSAWEQYQMMLRLVDTSG